MSRATWRAQQPPAAPRSCRPLGGIEKHEFFQHCVSSTSRIVAEESTEMPNPSAVLDLQKCKVIN